MEKKTIELRKDLFKSRLMNALMQIYWLREHGHEPKGYYDKIENAIIRELEKKEDSCK